jgi:hypothetical protein
MPPDAGGRRRAPGARRLPLSRAPRSTRGRGGEPALAGETAIRRKSLRPRGGCESAPPRPRPRAGSRDPPGPDPRHQFFQSRGGRPHPARAADTRHRRDGRGSDGSRPATGGSAPAPGPAPGRTPGGCSRRGVLHRGVGREVQHDVAEEAHLHRSRPVVGRRLPVHDSRQAGDQHQPTGPGKPGHPPAATPVPAAPFHRQPAMLPPHHAPLIAARIRGPPEVTRRAAGLSTSCAPVDPGHRGLVAPAAGVGLDSRGWILE